MKTHRFIKTLALALAFNATATVNADAQKNANDKPARYAAIVVDANNGKVLYERDADQRLHPASTTKVMTAYLTFEAIKSGRLKLDQKITVSENAAGQPRTNLGMMQSVAIKGAARKGHRTPVTYQTRQIISSITVENALKGMLCHSANDAAVVLAEAIGGSEEGFAKMMNAKAKSLGMNDTRYYNPNGLPDERQKMTVEDLALLARAVIRDFPEYYPYFNIQSFTFNGATYRNTNNMLGKYDGIDGLKTGWIATSGYNLAASAHRGDERVIGVVFGARSPLERKNDMTQLLDFGFKKITNPEAKFAFGRGSDSGTRYVELPPQQGEEDAPDVPKETPDTGANFRIAPQTSMFGLPVFDMPQLKFQFFGASRPFGTPNQVLEGKNQPVPLNPGKPPEEPTHDRAILPPFMMRQRGTPPTPG
ncbi:MAG: D-alanyl-D-alanine carboxypeptidase [Micavibrio sp.]|nr:D-alanyl-D-alanine carboxypeptidase [Micavibrio sp.]